MLEELIDLSVGLGVALMPLLVLCLPGIVLVVVPLAILLLPLALIGAVIAAPFLLARRLRRPPEPRSGYARSALPGLSGS